MEVCVWLVINNFLDVLIVYLEVALNVIRILTISILPCARLVLAIWLGVRLVLIVQTVSFVLLVTIILVPLVVILVPFVSLNVRLVHQVRIVQVVQ